MTKQEEPRRDSKRDDAYHGRSPSPVAALAAIAQQVTRDNHADELGPLPAELQKELRELERIFTVDTAKLKEIVLQFEEELREGLSRVSRCLLPSCDSPPCSTHFALIRSQPFVDLEVC